MDTRTFDVEFTTPVGNKNAVLELVINGNVVLGKLIQKRKEFPISGSINGEEISFSGVVKAALGKMDYQFTGKLEAGQIGGVMKTNQGDIPLYGSAK